MSEKQKNPSPGGKETHSLESNWMHLKHKPRPIKDNFREMLKPPAANVRLNVIPVWCLPFFAPLFVYLISFKSLQNRNRLRSQYKPNPTINDQVWFEPKTKNNKNCPFKTKSQTAELGFTKSDKMFFV